MKRISIIIVTAVLVILGVGIFMSRHTIMSLYYDRCGESIGTGYFDKKLILNSQDEVFPMATHYDPSHCKDTYKIRTGDSLLEVNEKEFWSFLEKYNHDCSDCLVYKSWGFVPCQAYYAYTTGKLLGGQASTSDTCQ